MSHSLPTTITYNANDPRVKPGRHPGEIAVAINVRLWVSTEDDALAYAVARDYARKLMAREYQPLGSLVDYEIEDIFGDPHALRADHV